MRCHWQPCITWQSDWGGEWAVPAGTNLVGALVAAQQMKAAGESGSIVAILCDGGERYATTYYNPVWLAGQGYELQGLIAAVAASVERGEPLPDCILRANI